MAFWGCSIGGRVGILGELVQNQQVVEFASMEFSVNFVRCVGWERICGLDCISTFPFCLACLFACMCVQVFFHGSNSHHSPSTLTINGIPCCTNGAPR